MHLWKIKSDMRLPVVFKTDQLPANRFIVEESKFVFADVGSLSNTGLIVKIVVIAEAVLVDDLVDHFTALAAKDLFFQADFTRGTIFTAMRAPDLLIDADN